MQARVDGAQYMRHVLHRTVCASSECAEPKQSAAPDCASSARCMQVAAVLRSARQARPPPAATRATQGELKMGGDSDMR